jgi:hypothetical protein
LMSWATLNELRQRDLIVFNSARELRLPDLPGLLTFVS